MSQCWDLLDGNGYLAEGRKSERLGLRCDRGKSGSGPELNGSPVCSALHRTLMLTKWEAAAWHVCAFAGGVPNETQINIKTTGNHVILLTRLNQAKVLGLDLPLLAPHFNFQIHLI